MNWLTFNTWGLGSWHFAHIFYNLQQKEARQGLLFIFTNRKWWIRQGSEKAEIWQLAGKSR